jgi:predicted ArsR family transcriptional regulator
MTLRERVWTALYDSGRMTSRDLADALGASQDAINGALAALINRGHVHMACGGRGVRRTAYEALGSILPKDGRGRSPASQANIRLANKPRERSHAPCALAEVWR